MPLSPTSGKDLEVARALLEVRVLPLKVTPIVDPAVGFSMTLATYPVPPVPMMSFVDSVPLEVAPSAGLAVGPAWCEALLRQFLSPALVASSRLSPSSPVLRPTPDVSPPSGFECYGPGVTMECFIAVGVFRGFPFASGSPDTESDGRGSGCPWVGGVFPGRGYRYGWGPPEDA